MHYVKIAAGVLFGIVAFLFLDYMLPSKHIGRVVGVENRLTDVGGLTAFFYTADNSSAAPGATGANMRDVRFLNTVRPDGDPFVYRNEDTGVWPPYFKFDSSNLHAEAADAQSTAANPEWVAITAYGWRVPILSIYPNAVSVSRVSGPGAAIINWGAILVLIVLGALLFLIWRMWNQFVERTIDPAADRMDAAWDRAGDNARETGGRIRNWFRRK